MIGALLLATFIGSTSPTKACVVLMEPGHQPHNPTCGGGENLISSDELLLRLVGTISPTQTSADKLRSRLEQAAALEADFDTGGANTIRQEILDAFASTLRPSSEIRAIAANALQDLAAALYASGKKADKNKAREYAANFSRQFGDHSVDTARHSPQTIALFDAAKAVVEKLPKAEIIVHSPSGELSVEGLSLGNSGGTLKRSLPVGKYRLWLRHDGNLSLPQILNLRAGDAAQVIFFQPAVDGCITLQSPLLFDCPQQKEIYLPWLAHRLGVDAIVTNADTESSPEEYVAQSPPIPEEKARPLPRSVTSKTTGKKWPLPLRILPLGIGHYFQGHIARGAIFSIITLASSGFYVSAASKHEQAFANVDPNEEARARTQVNIALGLIATSVIGSVVDAWLLD